MLVGQKLGDFEIEREIGSGAMGVVYRARYLKNDVPVAIKIISGGQDSNPNTVARFERETAILKKLSHPNIVKLYATGRLRGTPFYVMEFVAGETLEAMLERRGRFSWEEVVSLGRQVCDALQHAHHQGIVHRDLKPANIMMMENGIAKLMDFGIAKGLEVSQLTATNCTVGTAAYMSPEQCRGERDLTSKSDLYALGVLFFELLTGRRPFLATTTLDMFLAHTEGKFERPSRLVLDIPIWLDTLVCQMLEKKPQHRPYDAAMVSRALEEVQQKIGAQRSAGVEATSSSGSIQIKARVEGETDREVARTLRSASQKKRHKKKTRSLGERTWFQVVAICLLLGGVGTVVYLATRPPSANSLFSKAKALMESSDRDLWLQARDGPIQSFLRYYPDQAGDQAQKIRGWADQVDLDLKERQLRNRMRLKMSPENAPERLAQAADHSEQAGELAQAAQTWAKMKDVEEANAPAGHGWQLLADKRMKELNEADRQEAALTARLEQSRGRNAPPPPENETDRAAYQAIRAELFGDLALALTSWQKVKEAVDPASHERFWHLLALKKINELGPKAWRGSDVDEARKTLVRDKLSQAAEMRKSAPVLALAVYQDTVALYGKSSDPVLAGHAVTAKRALEEMTSSAPAPAAKKDGP